MQLLPSLYCVVLVLIVYLESGLALKCYNCNSYLSESCQSITGNTTEHLITCPGDSSGCRKMEQRLTYDGKEHIRLIRECATSEVELKCLERSGTLGVKIFYCTCDVDGCNSGSTLALSFALLASSTIFIQLFKNL